MNNRVMINRIFQAWHPLVGQETSSQSRGFTLIEVLVAIVIVAVVSLSTTYSTISSFALYHHSTRAALARQLAFARMEELAARNPLLLSEADNSIEEDLLINNISYNRSVAVLVNPDGSRTVTVTVQNNRTASITAQFSNTFALWGNT